MATGEHFIHDLLKANGYVEDEDASSKTRASYYHPQIRNDFADEFIVDRGRYAELILHLPPEDDPRYLHDYSPDQLREYIQNNVRTYTRVRT